MDSSNAPFTCPQCGKGFNRKDNLSRHMRSVHQGERYACDHCTKSFASNQKLNKHKCALSQQCLSEYRCSKCPEVFPSPRDLAVHFRRCHSSGATQTSRHDARPSTSRAVPVSGGTTSTNQPTPSTSSGQVARAGNSRVSGAPSSSRIAASDGCTTCRTCHRCHRRTAQRLLRRARRRLGRNKPVNNKARRLRSSTPVVGHFERRVKFSCKGISKRTLKTPLRAFRDVLRTRVPGEGLNRGFRLKGNTMCSYQQTRQGLSYLYCKRRVLADGIHTAPLDIELCPWPSRDDRLDDTDTFLAELLENLAEN